MAKEQGKSKGPNKETPRVVIKDGATTADRVAAANIAKSLIGQKGVSVEVDGNGPRIVTEEKS